MPTDTDKWLATEEATNQLLTHLERLKQEVEGYAQARTSLGDARDQLTILLGELSKMAQGSKGVIEKLSEIGTPEVLDRLAKLQQALLAVGRIVQKEEKSLGEVDGTTKEINKRVSEGTNAVLEQISQSQNELAAVRDQIPGLIAGEVKRQQRPLMILAVLILLATAALLILRFVGP